MDLQKHQSVRRAIKKNEHLQQANSYHQGKVCDAEGPLLVIDPNMHRGVEQHHGAPLDFVPINLLGHLVGPVGSPRNSYPGCALSLQG